MRKVRTRRMVQMNCLVWAGVRVAIFGAVLVFFAAGRWTAVGWVFWLCGWEMMDEVSWLDAWEGVKMDLRVDGRYSKSDE